MTFTHALSTNNYGSAKFIVDGSAANGTHTTIATALASASSGDTIFIRPGTYTENITLKAGVNLTAYGSDSSLNGTGKVIISGTCTMTTAGSVTISGIQLQTNSAVLLAITGSAASIVNLSNCYLNCTNNSGVTFSSSSGSAALNMSGCSGDLGTTGINLFAASSAGNLNIYSCNFTNSGAATTANTHSAGSLVTLSTYFRNPLTTSSTSAVSLQQTLFDCTPLNTTALTIGGSGTSVASYCIMNAGTASAISISSGLSSSFCTVSSSNTNAITGAGTHNNWATMYSGSSLTNNVTTQFGGIGVGFRNAASVSAGFIGEQIRANATSVSMSNSTPKTITSVSLTAGIWDISACGYGADLSGLSAFQLAISANDNSFTGTVNGDSSVTILATGTSFAASIPSFRVNLSTTTIYYAVGQCNFGSGTANANARISGTRVG